jgi:hypothetical protein
VWDLEFNWEFHRSLRLFSICYYWWRLRGYEVARCNLFRFRMTFSSVWYDWVSYYPALVNKIPPKLYWFVLKGLNVRRGPRRLHSSIVVNAPINLISTRKNDTPEQGRDLQIGPFQRDKLLPNLSSGCVERCFRQKLQLRKEKLDFASSDSNFNFEFILQTYNISYKFNRIALIVIRILHTTHSLNF